MVKERDKVMYLERQIAIYEERINKVVRDIEHEFIIEIRARHVLVFCSYLFGFLSSIRSDRSQFNGNNYCMQRGGYFQDLITNYTWKNKGIVPRVCKLKSYIAVLFEL